MEAGDWPERKEEGKFWPMFAPWLETVERFYLDCHWWQPVATVETVFHLHCGESLWSGPMTSKTRVDFCSS